LKDMQRRAGITFLFVTHDQEEALSLSDAMAVMNAGLLEQFGTPQDVYLRPATRFVASFLGNVNWIDGVGLRPESTRISRTQAPDSRPGKVTRTVFLGNLIQVHVKLSTGEDIQSEAARSDEPYREHESVFVHWDREDEMRFRDKKD